MGLSSVVPAIVTIQAILAISPRDDPCEVQTSVRYCMLCYPESWRMSMNSNLTRGKNVAAICHTRAQCRTVTYSSRRAAIFKYLIFHDFSRLRKKPTVPNYASKLNM